MRFDPRSTKKNFAFIALILAGFISFSATAHAQGTSLPQIKGAPKIDMNWSDAKKPRNMNFTQLRAKLRPADKFAALYALQVALSRIGDGQTYVWARPKRKLRTFITPVSSYRAKNGEICRKVIISIALGTYLKRIQTAACRAKDRSWQMQS